MRETWGFWKCFSFWYGVLVKTKRKTLWWTLLHSRDWTFIMNTTEEGFKNSKFTNTEMGLWVKLLLNHISVVSPVFLWTPWHRLIALICFFYERDQIFMSLRASVYGLTENKEASWQPGPWWVARAYAVRCVPARAHTRLTVLHVRLYLNTVENDSISWTFHGCSQ